LNYVLLELKRKDREARFNFFLVLRKALNTIYRSTVDSVFQEIIKKDLFLEKFLVYYFWVSDINRGYKFVFRIGWVDSGLF